MRSSQYTFLLDQITNNGRKISTSVKIRYRIIATFLTRFTAIFGFANISRYQFTSQIRGGNKFY